MDELNSYEIGLHLEIVKLQDRVAELETALHNIARMPHSDTCSTELSFMEPVCDCHVGEAFIALKGED